jgi:hypothetical protein
MAFGPAMATTPPPLKAAYYRHRERELRALAEAMKDISVREQMFGIAEEYAKLAELAEAWEHDHPAR